MRNKEKHMKMLDLILLIFLLFAAIGEGYVFFKDKKNINLIFSIMFLLFFILNLFKAFH